MHIAEGILPVGQAAAWTLAAAPFVVHGARAVVLEVREHPRVASCWGLPGPSPSCCRR